MTEIILPQSYLQRLAISKKAGLFTFVAWSDVAEGDKEFDEFRAQLASLHTENLLALISIISIIQTNTPSLAFLLEPINNLMGRKSALAHLKARGWRFFLTIPLAGLCRGFFWEMWNFHSLSKWFYTPSSVRFLAGISDFVGDST